MANILPIADDEDGLSVRNKLNEAITEANDVDNKVTGPASATDARIAVFDGVTGKLIKEVPVTIDDLGNIQGLNNILAKDFSITTSGNINTDISSLDNLTNTSLRLGALRAGSGNTFLDLKSFDLDNFYSARLLRNSGENGNFDIINRGTGNIVFYTNSSSLILSLKGDGSATFAGAVTVADLIPTLLNGVAIANYVQVGGDISGTGAAPVVANNAVTNAKLADMATAHFKGRVSSGTGDPEDLSASQVKTALNLPNDTETELAAKLPLAGGTMTGAILGNIAIQGYRPVADPVTASFTLSSSTANQFQYINTSAAAIAITLDTSTTNLAAIGTEWDFLVINDNNKVSIEVDTGVTAYAQGIGIVTGADIITVTGFVAFQIKKTASNEYAIIGGGLSV